MPTRSLLAGVICCVIGLVLIALGWHGNIYFVISLGQAMAASGVTWVVVTWLFPPS